jgi:transcriptional regulator, XRE family
MRLGERIKKARKGKGTQAELAEQIGVHEMTIRRWESGERYPDADMLQKLSVALGTSVSYLVGETDDPQTPVSVDRPSASHLIEGKNVVPPVADSAAPVVFQIGEMRLELPPTPETYAFLERQLRGILPTCERLPEPSQEDAGEQSA